MSAKIPAVVLAGDRGEGDKLSAAAGVACRALLPVHGKPVISIALEALHQADLIRAVTVTEPSTSALREAFADRDLQWMPSSQSPCSSVLAALDHAAHQPPVLITTADHAFLRAAIVDDFLRRAQEQTDADLVVGVAAYDRVTEAYPQFKKTRNRLRGGSWCGCNLFFFRTEKARRVAEFWRQVEQDRKRPWRIARRIGWGFLFDFLRKRLSLDDVLEHIGRRCDARIAALEIPFPEAAIDVDSIEDWRAVNRPSNTETKEQNS